jgi:DNA-binding LacI/PurR family transcriptional regulator
MEKHAVTIKDLARKLNISVSTVSRALRNVTDINPETKQSVLRLAQELNYAPNYMAQSLVKRKTKIVGVIVPAIHSHYFSQALSGMTDMANDHGYYLMFGQSNETFAQELGHMRRLVACNIDGLLISVSKETRDPAEFEKMRQKGLPIVMFDRILPDFNCNKVIVDEYEGAFKAVQHLIRKGCRRIAHIAGPQGLSISENRLNGYLDALKKHNLPTDQRLIVRCKAFEEDALPLIRKLARLDPLPDAIFAINDRSAVMALKYFRERNISVPGDIRIAGFNDDPISEVAEPSLTTVMQPGYEVGKLAMGILIDEIDNRSRGNQTYRLKTRLMIRNSSK